MSLFNRNDDSRLDEAIAQAANEPLDPAAVEAATARVWQRLSQGVPVATLAADTAAAAIHAVDGAASSGALNTCADFQSLIPAYLRGELAPARALLLEDHARGCVPCRRALREARDGKAAPVRPAESKIAVRGRRAVWGSLAAMLLLGVGAGAFYTLQDVLVSGDRMARVENVEGNLFLLDGSNLRPLEAGDRLDEGQLVRTAKASHAMLKMTDGSLIEMNERAGLELDAAREGNTIRLEGGQVIVHAAKQRQRHLFVATHDALVSVTGTIFSVNNGTKGTRVSVVEGEVRVKQARRDSILHPGDQVTTHASVAAVPIRSEIAWSENKAEYEQLLAELTALGRDIDAQVERPGLRTSTRLLDTMPAGTTVYIALPNLSQSLAETHRILDERIETNPLVRQWWSDTLGSGKNEDELRKMIARLGDLGRNLGDEIAIGMVLTQDEDGEGHDGRPVLLAEVTSQAAFRATLEQEIANAGHGNGDFSKHVVIVDNPAAVPPANGNDNDRMLLWVGPSLFVATPSPELLAQVAANYESTAASPFASTGFHDRIAESYRDGAGWLFAADLHTLVQEGHDEPSSQATAEKLGILDLDHFLIDRREIDGKVDTRAALTFDQPRRGIASWLAAPSSMQSLRFFSPDANLVASFVVKNPVSIIDDLLATDPKFGEALTKLQNEQGIDLRNDIAAAMGGEFAFGVDGPLVPTPSWKLVAEVYDPARLQATLESLVQRVNAELRGEGHKGQADINEQNAGGRIYYTVSFTGGGEGKPVSFVYTFEEGFLLASPSRALLDRAIQQRDSGVTLSASAKLRDLLGPDGQVNVSALVYQNLAPVLNSAGRVLPGAATNSKPGSALRAIIGQGPTVAYAYGYPDRIQFGTSSESPLGLNLETLASFGGFMGLVDEVHDEAVAAQGQAAQAR